MISHRQRGFTLIEIMMVVALIGLTLTMAFPSFLHELHRKGLGKAEHDIVAVCQDARRQAILTGETTQLVFHPSDGTFGVEGMSDEATLPNDVQIVVLGVNFNDLKDAPAASVRFFNNGTSDEFKIVLHGADNSYRTIKLDIATALVDVEDGISLK